MLAVDDLSAAFAALMAGLADPRQTARMKVLKAAIAKTAGDPFFRRFLLARMDVLSEGGAAMLLQMAMASIELRPVGRAWLDQGGATPPWLEAACPPRSAASPILWRTPSSWRPKLRLRLTGRGSVLAAHGKQVLEYGLEDGGLRHRWRLPEQVTQFVASPDGEALVVAAGLSIHRMPWRGKANDTITVTRPADNPAPIIYLGFDESGEHLISAREYFGVAIHRATDLEVVAATGVHAQFALAHPLGGNVLAYGIREHNRKLVIVDVRGGAIQTVFGDDVRGYALVPGGRIVTCEAVSGKYVLRLRRLDTTEVLDELDLPKPVEAGQVSYKTLSLAAVSPCGQYAAVQVISYRNSDESETLLVDRNTRLIHPLGYRTVFSVFTPGHLYVKHRRGLARFDHAGNLTTLLPSTGATIDLAIEGDRGTALVDRGGVIGSYELVGLDLAPPSTAIPSAQPHDPVRSLATFPDGSLRGLIGKAQLVTIDPTTGATMTEIALGQAYSNVLVPLRGERVLLDGPARLLNLLELPDGQAQAIEGGEGSQYESVSVDRDERFALATFDESYVADLIDLIQHRVVAQFGTSEKNARITAAALHPDGTFALLGSDQGRITQVSTDMAQPKRPLAKLPGAITTILCVPGGSVAASEKWLAFVPFEGGLRKVAHHAGASARLAVSTDNTHLAIAGDTGRIEVWSLPELVCMAWTDLGTAATSIAFHGPRIVAADSAGVFHSFDLR